VAVEIERNQKNKLSSSAQYAISTVTAEGFATTSSSYQCVTKLLEFNGLFCHPPQAEHTHCTHVEVKGLLLVFIVSTPPNTLHHFLQWDKHDH
jgi:hypothetical protein